MHMGINFPTEIPLETRNAAVSFFSAGKVKESLLVLAEAGLLRPEDGRMVSDKTDSQEWSKFLHFLSDQAAADEEDRKAAKVVALYPFILTHVVSLGVLGLWRLSGEFVSLSYLFVACVPALLTGWFCLFTGWRWGCYSTRSGAGLRGLIPWLSVARRRRSLSRFAAYAGYGLRVGRPFPESLRVAGEASGSAVLREASEDLAERGEQGQPPGLYMHAHLCFPEDFAHTVRKGEEEDDLAEYFEYLSRRYRELARMSLWQFFFWTPKLAILPIVPLLF